VLRIDRAGLRGNPGLPRNASASRPAVRFPPYHPPTFPDGDIMALLGQAALAMWWNMAPGHRREFEHWHSHEHFPERLGIPGFRRASRWAQADGGPGFFVLYELEAWETLASDAYLERLNAPTPWSLRMMPHHADMVRSQCRVLHSCGGVIAAHALTARFSPRQGSEEGLQEHLRSLAADLAARPGLAGAHLLRTQAPALAQTVEQEIRGGKDAVADWIFVACGYDAAALRDAGHTELGAQALTGAGAAAAATLGQYTLALGMVPGDPGVKP
jgi:hypothetical protein